MKRMIRTSEDWSDRIADSPNERMLDKEVVKYKGFTIIIREFSIEDEPFAPFQASFKRPNGTIQPYGGDGMTFADCLEDCKEHIDKYES